MKILSHDICPVGWFSPVDLSFLSNFRIFLPTLEEYFSEAIEQADPDAMVEEEYKYEPVLKYPYRSESYFS